MGHLGYDCKKYWIACDSGLVQYDPKTRHLNYRGHNVDNDPVIKAFEQQRVPMTPFVDKAGNVIYQHWPPMWGNPYIHKYNRKTGKAENYGLVIWAIMKSDIFSNETEDYGCMECLSC